MAADLHQIGFMWNKRGPLCGELRSLYLYKIVLGQGGH